MVICPLRVGESVTCRLAPSSYDTRWHSTAVIDSAELGSGDQIIFLPAFIYHFLMCYSDNRSHTIRMKLIKWPVCLLPAVSTICQRNALVKPLSWKSDRQYCYQACTSLNWKKNVVEDFSYVTILQIVKDLFIQYFIQYSLSADNNIEFYFMHFRINHTNTKYILERYSCTLVIIVCHWPICKQYVRKNSWNNTLKWENVFCAFLTILVWKNNEYENQQVTLTWHLTVLIT